MVLLHLVRADLSPMSDRLSEYANGSFGVVMTASFLTLGAGMVVLGLATRLDGTWEGWSLIVPLGVIAAGCGMVVSGLYPTDPAGASTTTERVHSLASGSASVALIAAAVASTLLSGRRRARPGQGPAGLVAWMALGFGAVSPVLHETAWTGLGQRLLWLTLIVWLLLTAWRRAPRSCADAPVVAMSGSGR